MRSIPPRSFPRPLRRVFLVGTTIALGSCARQAPLRLEASDAAKLSGARIAVVRRDTPPFRVESLPQGALYLVPQLGPIVGRTASTRAGKKVVQSHDIDDPATAIGRELAAALSRQCGATLSSPVVLRPQSDLGKAGAWMNGTFNNKLTAALNHEGSADLARAGTGADYVLDVKTTDWSAGFYLTDWLRYRARYTSELRLVDAKSGKLVARGRYTHAPKKSAASPRYDALLANDAAVLKAEIQAATDAADAYFKTEVLGLPVHSGPVR